jgi:cellulose biosynthesis protein BcsQ
VRLAEAPSHGLPALLYDAHSKGAESYLDLAREMVGQVKVVTPKVSSRRQKRIEATIE